MQQRMISDSLIVVGIILVVVGWRGIGAEDLAGLASVILLIAGILLGGWGLIRYIKGHNDPKDD